MRVVALLATYNEERYIAGCLEHLFEQGIQAYVIDNCSTDRTLEIAERYLGGGLIGTESFPREQDVYPWSDILKRKEELAQTIDADWFMHADPDEIRLPPHSGETLARAIAAVDEMGYNAVNFLEFTFVPTKESPDHDHPGFRDTMRWYYPFLKKYPYQVKAWKTQPERVDLVSTGGHMVDFPGRLLYPEPFKMRHYPYLSLEHGVDKYFPRKYEAATSQRSWRRRLEKSRVQLPSENELNVYTTDDELDASNPRWQHVTERWARPLPTEDSSKPDTPIIVGGCFRSGTSLVRRILDSHSRIHCGPEVKFFRDFYGDYRNDPIKHGRFFWTAKRILPERQLMGIMGRSFVNLHKRAAVLAGKSRWADKAPENVLYLKEWERLLEDEWVFVHVVRNPLDTLASIKEMEFPFVIPPDLMSRIQMYKSYTTAGLSFGERHPERYYRIVYERLVEDPKNVVDDLMGWLGEEFEPVQLDFNSTLHQKGLEDRKVRETAEIHAESVGRWKELLTSEEVEKITEECDPLWREISGDAPAGAGPKSLVHRALGGALQRIRARGGE